MSECFYCQEGLCALEPFENVSFIKNHPCKFAKFASDMKVLRNCTASEKDLVEVDDG